MKIGTYGGICNNGYVMARALAENDVDVLHIRARDPMDLFPFNQPSWNDVPQILPYQQVYAPWLWPQWAQREKELSWNSPKWMTDPFLHVADAGTVHVDSRVGQFVGHCVENLRRNPHWAAAVTAMRGCDGLIVSGIAGVLLAWMSGKPFIAWPHGMDIRQAVGMNPPEQEQGDANPLLVAAFGAAECIASHSPTSGACYGDPLPALGQRLEYLPWPAPTSTRLPKPDRRKLLGMLLAEMRVGFHDAETIVFVPSRVDFLWKGQDRLADEYKGRDDIHFIFSGWGGDLPKLREMMPDATFLPFAVSRPILRDLFRAADVAVDEFKSGEYGSGLVDAAACGCPVVTHIDRERYAAKEMLPPPVADTVDAAVEMEGRIASWASNRHSEEVFARRVREIFRGLVAPKDEAANRTRAERTASAKA